MNPDNIPPQLLALLLQNPELAAKLPLGQGQQGAPGLPGMRGGMPPHPQGVAPGLQQQMMAGPMTGGPMGAPMGMPPGGMRPY